MKAQAGEAASLQQALRASFKAAGSQFRACFPGFRWRREDVTEGRGMGDFLF